MYSTTKIIRTIGLIGTFALAVTTGRAVSPPPDGGYAGGNTAEGQDALFNLSISGIQNTALGFESLFSETSVDNNTATGYKSLHSNLTAALKAQASQIETVSDQLKAQAPVPRVVAND